MRKAISVNRRKASGKLQIHCYYELTKDDPLKGVRGLSQIMFALRVGRWSEKRVVYYIKSAN